MGRSQPRDREKKPAWTRRRLDTPGKDPDIKGKTTYSEPYEGVPFAWIYILHFSLTGSLFGRHRLAHAVGILSDDGHQVVGP